MYTLMIQGTVAASTAVGTIISNTASVTSTTSDPTTPNTATASAAASTQADLSVTIADFPGPVMRSQNVTYQVVVANGGPSDAASPSLSVVLDPALHFSSAQPPAGWTCTTPANNNASATTTVVTPIPTLSDLTFAALAALLALVAVLKLRALCTPRV